jgi:hypothetical protein
MNTIPAEYLFVDRYGILRIKERVLTVEEGKPVLMSFDEARMVIDCLPGETPDDRAVKIANRAVLERSMPKLMPYQGSDDPGNRILSGAKQHAILHRALWIRNVTTLDLDWSSSRCKRYITEEDLQQWPTLKDFVADPDTQYRDARSERSGHVMLRDEHISDLLGWTEEITSGVDVEKLQNRQAIAGRLEQVPWVELPDAVELVLLTDEEASARFGKAVPDGIIPVTNAAAWSLKAMSRSGNPVALKSGDKLRGGTILPFKGTVQKVPGNRPQLFLVEGGALKVKIGSDTPRKITASREQIKEGAFALETPSQERLIRNPRFGTHMTNLIIGQLRKSNPAAAQRLVPRVSDHSVKLASGTADLLEYVSLCLYPVKGYKLNRKLALDVCQQIIDGELVVPILRGVITVPGAEETNFYKFGITSAGRLLLRGVPVTYEAVWSQLLPRIGSEIMKELRPRVSGAGGLAQADPGLPLDTVRVSRKLGQMLRSRVASIMYWPSKYPHCLHKVKVVADHSLDGSVVVVHPDILDTLGGDCDGDLIYLITDPEIVAASRSIATPVIISDRISGEKVKHPDVIEMVRSERAQAANYIEKMRSALLGNPVKLDGHERMAKVNASADQIGMAFVARDLIVDALGYHDDRVYVRMGMLCQEALDGLKVTTPVDVVQILLDDPARLSEFLRVPIGALPYDAGARAVWRSSSRVRNMYRAWSDKRSPVSQSAGAARAAKTNAESTFEWIIARTGLDGITLPKVITRSDLKEKASHMLEGLPDKDVRQARYELVKSRSMQVHEDGLFVPMTEQPLVSLQDHRFGRIRYLLNHGVDPRVLRAVVLEHVGRKPDAMEALGLLTALRSLAAAS